ncbi:MAG: primosomal protein N' [Phycisphaeraceae bacterium]
MAQLFDTGPAPAKPTPAPPAGYAHIALEQNIDLAPAGLTYAVPANLADLAIGQRVRVPLGRGNKPVAGYVIERLDHTAYDPAKVKPILERDARALSLPADLIDLARWIASYYCCPLGLVLASMIPAAVKHGTGTTTQTLVGLVPDTGAVPSTSEIRNPKFRPPTALQRKILDTARQRAADGYPFTPIKELADLAGARTVSPVKQLLDKGLLIARHQQTVGDTLDLKAHQQPAPIPTTLSPDQTKALDHLTAHAADAFSVHLLHGVTGSGKTEVYLRLIEHLLANQKSEIRNQQPVGVIILVPEIALTPQTVARFVARFDTVAVLHSGLTASQRHAQWRRIRAGDASIVVGARSAVFAPLVNPRLIIVDEEHESSYKQDQAPRYHARDVAIRRAQQHNIPIVLGSATPSLESLHRARTSPRYRLITMPSRVPGMTQPRVEIVDMTDERRKRYQNTGKAGVHLVSLSLELALRQTLESKSQAMLLLNRRGYANYIACPDQRCGWVMRCHHCDTTMVYHRDKRIPSGGHLRCHHCEAEQLLPETCPTCAKKVTVFGLGTQRVEEELASKFPAARTARLDSDAMRTGSDYQHVLDSFRNRELDILLGTQMIAKGLDFPDVGLVGVISGDTALHLPDFRAAERTFQLIAQVAGRAGRSDKPARVLIQTLNPDDPTIQLAAQLDYDTFADRELNFRQQVGLPPITRMARIVIRDVDPVACTERARAIADDLARHDAELNTNVRLRGPMPCPIARIADHHRQQIELIAPDASSLQRLLTALRNTRALTSDMHTAIDVDPMTLL